MLRYTKFQYYIEKFFHVSFSFEFRMSLVSAVFGAKHYPLYNLVDDLFDLDKTWR